MRTLWVFTITAFLITSAFGQTKTPEDKNDDLLLLKCSLDAVCSTAIDLVYEDDKQWTNEWRDRLHARQVGMSEKEAGEEQKRFIEVGVKHNEEVEDCLWVINGIKLTDFSPTNLQERKVKANACAARYIGRAKAIVDAKDAAKDRNRK